MATAKNKRYGRVEHGDTIPYGTLANADYELRQAYYYFGYRNDHDMPPLPCPPVDMDEPYTCAEEELYKKELAAVVSAAIDTLAPRLAKTIRLRYGFGGGAELTLEEVGYAFRVGKERARQLEAKAIRQLKHPFRCDTLRAAVYPQSQEEMLIEKQRFEKEHRELQQKLAEEANKRYRQQKQFDAKVYKETDKSWLDYVKRVDPKLHELVMANADRIMRERGWSM